jgi:hypothetical protein
MEEEKIMESVDQVWQDPYIGTAGLKPEDFVDTNKSAVGVAVLVPCESGSGELNLDYSCVGKKYLWRRPTLHGLSMMPMIYYVIEDDLGFPGEAVGSVSPWPLLWRHDEPEFADSRGVFPTNYRRKVLFTKKVTLRTSELPRWKPKAIIGLRTFEEEDV